MALPFASTIASDLLPQRDASRRLGRHAMFWLASTIFHTVVFAVSDTPWAGSVSWRKPIVFSLSFALILWAFGWILDRLPDRPKMAGRLAATFAWSSAFELVLIIGQQWRGRPSHFSTEGVDGIVFSLMGMTVVVISVSIIVLLVWAIRRRPENRTERLVVFAGLAMIVSGLGFGQWLIEIGNSYVSEFDRVPEATISGEAGVAKFPHAVAFHGMQVFMIAAAMLRQFGASAVRSLRTMWVVVIAYFGVLVFSALQSFGGRAPADLNAASGSLLGLSVVVLVAAFASIVRRGASQSGVVRQADTTLAA